MSARLNRKIRAELRELVSMKLLEDGHATTLAERYPTSDWNVASLARWFTILGVVSAGAGLIVLVKKALEIQAHLDLVVAVASAASIAAGRWLARNKSLVKTGAALELLGSFGLQGLSFILAVKYSRGSDNWPALIGIDTVAIAVLAYVLGNRLILIHACVNLFLWFGGETGYISGWGAYWLGMNYPLRFLAAGMVTLGLAYVHGELGDRWQHFARVYYHFGLLIIHLALWFLAIFGYFEKEIRWDGTQGQRLAFSLLWAVVSLGCIAGASKLGLGLIRGYGVVFLIINVYTFYFQFVVAHSSELWFLHLLLTGGSMVGLGFWLEKWRREHRGTSAPPAVGPAAPS